MFIMFVNKKIQTTETFIKVAVSLSVLFFAFSVAIVSATTHTISQVPASTSTPTLIPTSTTDLENETEEKPSTEENLVSEDLPPAPEIESQIFSDPEIWYKSMEGVFNWTLPSDVNAVAIEISTSSENKPELNEKAVFEPPVSEFIITKDLVEDGVQFLSISFRNQTGWGTALNHKIQIDTIDPEQFEVIVNNESSSSSFPAIFFEAKDETSGVDYYEIIVGGSAPIKITPNEARKGYRLSDLVDGTYLVKVVAYDKAGNFRESNREVLIAAGWIKPVEQKSFWSCFTPTNIFIFFLITIILLQFFYILHKLQQIKIKEEKLRRENREVQNQMEKIFSALRDEIYDQIGTITKRKRLSKSEKDAVKGLNQALEVSETLIEKEINDVNEILK